MEVLEILGALYGCSGANRLGGHPVGLVCSSIVAALTVRHCLDSIEGFCKAHSIRRNVHFARILEVGNNEDFKVCFFKYEGSMLQKDEQLKDPLAREAD